MEIVIKQVTNTEDARAMLEVRRRVFEHEMGIRLAPGGGRGDDKVCHLIARASAGREAVGTLSLIDTSGDEQLHEGHNLGFERGARAARFMHLAVLKPFRGRNIPAMMMLEAHRRFVAPRGYDYTWLLFNAERAATSFLARLLGFSPKADIFTSEYGRRCPLVRDERAAEAAEVIRRAEQLLQQSGALYALAPTNGARRALSA